MKKQFKAVVVSTSTDKSAVVKVETKYRHRLLQKVLTKRKKHLVHDPVGVKMGERVVIAETRPLSKRKRFKIIKVLKNK